MTEKTIGAVPQEPSGAPRERPVAPLQRPPPVKRMGEQPPPDPFNMEHLSRAEIDAMDWFSGDSGLAPVMRGVGNFIQQNPVVGDVLSRFDWAAEGVERAIGFGTQVAYGMSQGERWGWDEIRAAWYAGGLAADFANVFEADPESGGLAFNINAMSPLPGLGGIIQARQHILDTHLSGGRMDHALVDFRERVYSDYGALAFRMGMQDAIMHIAGDPMNIPLLRAALPTRYLQPTRWNRLRQSILTGTTTPAIADELTGVATAGLEAAQVAERVASGLPEEIAAFARQVGAVGDAGQQTEMLQRLGQMVAGLVEPPDELVDLVRAVAGSVTDEDILQASAALGQRVVDAIEDTLAGEVARYTGIIENIESTPFIGAWQERFLRVSGGVPGETFGQSAAGRLLTGALGEDLGSRVGQVVQRVNPFSLTPRAQAMELVNMVADNLNAYIFARSNDPVEIVRAISRAADGMLGPEFGHMAVSLQGRSVRGVLGMLREASVALLKEYDDALLQRGILSRIADMMPGETPYTVMTLIRNNEAPALMERLGRFMELSPDAAEDLGRFLESFGMVADDITAEYLTSIGRLFPPDLNIFTPEMFKLTLANMVGDAAARHGIQLFGVSARGLYLKAADALKSAETLAFLRLNPGFPIRNFFNNEITMVARGASGISFENAMRLWERLGFEPPRLRAAATQAGLPDASALSSASRILGEAEMGTANWFDRVANRINNIRFRFDMGAWAQQIERKASSRALTSGYLQGWGYFWDQMRPAIDDVVPDLRAMVGDEIVDGIEGYLRDGMSVPEIRERLFDQDLSVSASRALDEAGEVMGQDLQHILTPEFRQEVMPGLVRAAREGETALMDELQIVRGNMQNYLDHATDNAHRLMLEEAQALINLEGPAAYGRLLNDVSGDFGASHGPMWATTSQQAELIRALDSTDDVFGDLQNAMWNMLAERQNRYWSRVWTRMDARVEGIVTGARNAGIPYADEFAANYQSWRRGWNSWHDWYNAEKTKYWDAVMAGNSPHITWSALSDESSVRYALVAQDEYNYLQNMDRAIEQMMPEELQPLFRTTRDQFRQWQQTDRAMVENFRESIRGMSADEVSQAYRSHWIERQALLRQQATDNQMAAAALRGDPGALERYQALMDQSDEVAAIQQRLTSNIGYQPTPEEMEILGQFAARTPEGRRLRGEFGEWSQDTFDQFYGAMEQNLRGRDTDVLMSWNPDDMPEGEIIDLDLAIYGWASNEPVWKEHMIRLAQGEDGQRLQDFSQWYLREHGFDNVNLSSIRVQRGMHGIPLEELEMGAWSSVTTKGHVAQMHAGAEGIVLEFDVPVENIFTHHRAHPGFTHITEAEYILNDQGIRGAYLVSINGEAPTAEQVATLSRNMPGVFMPPTGAYEPGAVLSDMNSLVPRQQFIVEGLDDLWLTRGDDALRAVGNSLVEQARTPPLRIGASLDDEATGMINQYIRQAEGAMGDATYASLRHGEFVRDSALLNYNRRYNYNNWLGSVFPYEFWATQSMYRWALHSMDGPNLLANYYRIQKLMNEVYTTDENMPGRLRGMLRIPMPFRPDWMGDSIYVDPFALAMPFNQWNQAFAQFDQQGTRDAASAERVLGELLNDGNISQEEHDAAMESREGPVWERAMSLVMQDDQQGRLNGVDFASTLVSPHAPVMWAINAARGEPFAPGPFMPGTRQVKGITAVAASLLGIPMNNGGYNPEAMVRRAMGLPAFDEWDDYRTDRMLANMVADGELSSDIAVRAMIERDEATGEILEHFLEARRRAGIEYGIGTIGNLFGTPSRIYPPGEEHLRSLYDEYRDALSQYYDEGDNTAIQEFNEEYPEFEARQMALMSDPEDRARRFLIDEVWDTYNNLPDLTRREVREQLGDTFQMAFINRDSRSYDSIRMEELTMWLRLMGGDPPGTLPTEETAPLRLAPPHIAQIAQVFYNTREQRFPNWYELQDEYYSLQESARGSYSGYPQLRAYWDWREQWMLSNPQVTPYLTDSPPLYPSEADMRAATQSQPQFTPQEWQGIMGPVIFNLAIDATEGQALPPTVRARLEEIAEQYGTTVESILTQVVQ